MSKAQEPGKRKEGGKPRVCKYFARSGKCKLGDRCEFLHSSGADDAPSNSSQAPSGVTPMVGAPSPANLLATRLLDAIRPKEPDHKPILPMLIETENGQPVSPQRNRIDLPTVQSAQSGGDLAAQLPAAPSLSSTPFHSSLFLASSLSPLQRTPAPPGLEHNALRALSATWMLEPPSLPSPSTSASALCAPPALAAVATPALQSSISYSPLHAATPSASAQNLAAAPSEPENGLSLPAPPASEPTKTSLLLNLLKIDRRTVSVETPVCSGDTSDTGSEKAAIVDAGADAGANVGANVEAGAVEEVVAEPEIENGVKQETESEALAAPIPKRLVRQVHNQSGALRVIIRNTRTQGDMEVPAAYYMRPGFRMTVEWRLPCRTVAQKDHNLVIGLLRFGTFANTPTIVAKPISLSKTNESGNFFIGTVPFFAPKTAGKFIFRLFDQHSKESAVDTLATSVMFSVALIDSDIASNLAHVHDAFQEGALVKAVCQLASIVQGVKVCSNDNMEVINAFNSSIDRTLDAVNASFAVLSEGATKKALEKSAEQALPENSKGAEDWAGDSGDDAFWQSYRTATRLHTEVNELFTTLLACKTPWYLVSEKLKNTIKFMLGLYCPLLRRFFPNRRDLEEARRTTFGFTVAPPESSPSKEALQLADHYLQQFVHKLLPPYDFQAARERAREKLEKALLQAAAVPAGSLLLLYGSSANSFGSANSDMDMCLFHDRPVELTAAEKAAMIEKISAALMTLGLLDVRTRPTARIPIVQFHDPTTGVDGDISLHNPLALANTRLLRTYSDIDPRVGLLVFIIKAWAKVRHINSPSEGTLSSYGFILILIHYLQNRPVPLLPSLQQLPPDWNLYPARPTKLPPEVLERNAGDGQLCNVYFFAPSESQMRMLRHKASENRESLAELLLGFFRYFAWEFDFRHRVVSIRQPGQIVWKIDKCEYAAWPQSDVLSIEDPFEVWYDVAHVIKTLQMTQIRSEFMRAFTIMSSLVANGNPSPVMDGLPQAVLPAKFIELLCAEHCH